MTNDSRKDKGELRSTRDAFGEALMELGTENENIVVLSADLSESTRTKQFNETFPKRFFQVGVAEQNMAGIAAGLALSGKIPFMTSFAVFSPGRNWDQIRVSICYSGANVKIASSHAGLASGPDGASHQALEDIALTRVLPNLTVICPADYNQTKKAVKAVAAHTGPVYLRLFRPDTPLLTGKNDIFEIGKAQVLQEGTDVTLAGTGPILAEVLAAAKELGKRNISCEVINVSTIKPLDRETILASVKKTKRIITVEDHQVHCGLGGAVAELVAQEFPVPLKIIGVEDTFGESGKYEELLDKYGLSAKHIYKRVVDFLKT